MKSKCLLIGLMLAVLMAACETNGGDEWNLKEEDGLKDTLTIELVGHDTDSLLYRKIMAFADRHPDLDVNVRRSAGLSIADFSSWILGGESSGDPPDILELTPTQMKLYHHHGKIEELPIRESEYQDHLIHSPDGYILGVKTKINPLVVYYNRDIFQRHGLELPEEGWDWTRFEQIITALKEKKENVYIFATPYILEWLAMNRFGGRIADADGMTFGGYLDSEEAVRAAEWIFWVNTRLDNYRSRNIMGRNTHWPMPYDLIEDNMALAVNYAYYIESSGLKSYFDIHERNERIELAPLPGGQDVTNTALISGLAIHKASRNKGAALALIRYLLKESDDYLRDTVVQTHQWGATAVLPSEGNQAWSIILREAARSVPVTLALNEGRQWVNQVSERRFYPLYNAMLSESSAKEVLERFALEFDQQFELFKKDLNSFYTCLKNDAGKLCQQY